MPDPSEGNLISDELNGAGPELGVFIVVPPVPGSLFSQPAPIGRTIIRFLDQPTLTESRAARYTTETILHTPEGFNSFEGTDQRSFELSGKFFCRTDTDIVTNNNVLQVVRSLVMPDYNRTGAPPTPVELHAYGAKNIFALPCLVKSYNMTYPNDVDYVVSDLGETQVTMPIVFELSISLTEQHSIAQLRKFNLSDFRSGKMVGQGF